jgi:type 1 glutamine amidotransferase/HEAT repeat protein
MKLHYLFPVYAVLTAGVFAQPAATPSPSPKVYTTPALAIAPIPAADLVSIKAALPTRAAATPKQPRKLLLFYRAEGFAHPSIPYGVEAIRQLGEKTGAYTAVSSDDMAMFDPLTLKQFDGVVFVSTTQLKFENPSYRKALLDFVASGKGVIGIHAASDNFPTWPEGQELMGGVFHGHPWHAGDLVAVKLDDPAHPLNSGFNNQGFRLKEEIYQITGPYGREKQRELVSLDMSKPENLQKMVDKDGKPLLDKGGKPVIARTDNDFPISWIKKEGGGRVFYTSLGHNKDIYFVPQILKHYLDGIQYALGDLPADDMPTASLGTLPKPALAPEGSTETLQKVSAVPEPPKKPPVPQSPSPTPSTSPVAGAPVPQTPEQVKELGEVSLKALPKYAYGDSTEDLYNVLEALRKGDDATRVRFESVLVGLLQDASATPASKETVCRWLGWMGREDAVPVLTKIADSSIEGTGRAAGSLNGYAIRALATIPATSADQALVELLSSGDEGRRIAVMSAVAVRGTNTAIPKLSKIAASKSPALSGAAFQTLAALHTVDSLNAILKVEAAPGNSKLQDEAVICTASSLVAKGAALPDVASAKLSSIAGTEGTYAQRLSALRVLLSAHLSSGLQQAAEMLKNDDYRLREGAAESLAELATPDQLSAISWEVTPDAWVVLLKNLAQKGSVSSLTLFQKALASSDSNVRLAAIDGISHSGGGKNLETLTLLLSDTNAPLAQAGKRAVAGLKGGDVGDRLIVMQGSATPALSAILLSILADRQDHRAFEAAIAAMSSQDQALRSAGYGAFSRLAASGDLSKCMALVPTVKEAYAENFQKGLVRAVALDPSPSSAAAQISGAFDQGSPAQKEIMINVLARLEVKDANDKLQTILSSADVEQRKQAVRALSSARSTASLELLPAVAENGQTNSEKILALKGYIDTIGAIADLKDNKRFEAYQRAWKVAVRDEEKAAVRSAVNKIPEKKIPKTKDAADFLKEINSPSPQPAATQPSPAKI